ncbi:MAG: 1-deoxy-D-xylulose-5-phosphate reductoisomerase [Candidatus Auribacterota bacterium]
MKNISILGSTGSIGISTLKVVDAFSGEFRVIGLSAHSNIDLLIKQCIKYKPKIVTIVDETHYQTLKNALPHEIEVCAGTGGLNEVAAHPDNDLTIAAIVGSAGLYPTIEAIECGIDIGLANKEILVMAGSIITKLAKKNNVSLLPVDSEHNALFQCLNGEDKKSVRRLMLTASGGPFLNLPAEDFNKITVAQALAHPKWSMGKKISIDSATMMNKGLEVIEAHWLFSVPVDDISVIVHPESIIHSMVEFVDGSYLAQMNVPDMIFPIQHVLFHPERRQSPLFREIDFCSVGSLNFQKPDIKKFPCLELAYEAVRIGHTMPAVLNAANEETVMLFLNDAIKFVDIPCIISGVMDQHKILLNPNIEELKQADVWARQAVKEHYTKMV